MMNAVADPRQPYWHPSWIEPDPHYRAIRREHTKRALALAKELGAPSIQTEPGGPLAAGPDLAGRRQDLLRRDDALRRTGRAAGGAAADRAGAGPADRAFRAVPGVRRPGRFAVAGAEFRHRPRLLRRRGPARLDRPHGPPHQALSRRGHRRHAQPPAPGSRAGGIDFAAVLREIARSGYQGWITVELYPYIDDPDAAGREAREFLERTVP